MSEPNQNSVLSPRGSVYAPQSSSLRVGFLTCELTHKHGWAHYGLSLIQALRRAGASVTVVASHNTPLIESVEVHPLLPSINPRENGLLYRMAMQSQQIKHMLRDCDVIHCAIEPYAPLASWIADDRPLFITGHGSYIPIYLKSRWPVNILYRRAFERARLVCVSHYTEKVVHSVLPKAQTTVVNNGVDVERFQSLGKPNTQPSVLSTILSVGAVKPRKGTLELVRAMAEVRRQIPAAQCVIIGSLKQESAYVQQVQAAIHDLGLKDCVHLLDHVSDEDLRHWYSAADVFVVPAMNDGQKFEGYGIVYLEASAAGLPVIGTTENGAEDAVDDGVTGLLVPQSQVAEKLPQAIVLLLSDPELAARMGAAGREKAARQTWDHVAQQMIGVYNNVEVESK